MTPFVSDGPSLALGSPRVSREVRAKNYLDTLSNEVLEMIVYEVIDNAIDYFAKRKIIQTIERIARTCKRLYFLANPILYRYDIQHGNSGLFWAARKDRVDVFQHLVEHGAPPDTVVAERTPLSEAILFESTDVVRYLVSLPEVDVNRKSKHNGIPPLQMAMNACQPEIAQLMLTRKDLAIDAMTWEERTALHFAAVKNMTRVACILINRGADPNARNNSGWSPLSFAVSKGNADMVRLFLDTGNVDVNHAPRVHSTLASMIDIQPLYDAVVEEFNSSDIGREVSRDM